MADLNAWAKAFQERVNEKIAHVNQIIEQKLEYQQKFLEQRLANVGEINAEKLLGFSSRLEEALAEIRGYKDILQQQLTLLDNSVKKVHARVDEAHRASQETAKELQALREEVTKELQGLKASVDKELVELRGEIATTTGNLTGMEGELKKIQDLEREEEIVKTTRKNDPVRRFLAENGQKVLVFILVAIGMFIIRNFDGFMRLLQSLGPHAGGG